VEGGVDGRETVVDADELRALLGDEVLAKGGAAVELEHQAAEVA